MKLLTFIFLCFCAARASAAQANFAWDANPTPGTSNVFYISTAPMLGPLPQTTNVLARYYVGTNRTAHLEMSATGMLYFACAALKADVESDISTVLPIEVPAPNPNFRTVAVPINWSGSVTGNWFNAGTIFLKLSAPTPP